MHADTRGPAVIGAIASVVLVVAGVIVWLSAASGATSFGWYAYAPPEPSPVGPFLITGQHLVAAGLVVLGLISAAVALGFRWGNKVGRVEAQTGPGLFSPPSPQ